MNGLLEMKGKQLLLFGVCMPELLYIVMEGGGGDCLVRGAIALKLINSVTN